uniref:Ribonuclease H-like domain-containing protein n=1 Tax=Tanacetum cinerariifolium TaxID=118510 RepID=A0A699HHA4_TANCI|nr:ribonuclease H-like domain-containing protein [Tanacetum cinerariifolium]
MFVDRPNRENEAITSSTCLKRKLHLSMEVNGSIITIYKVGGSFLPLVEPEAASLPSVGTHGTKTVIGVNSDEIVTKLLGQLNLNSRVNTTGGDTVSQPLVVPPQTSPTGPVYQPVAYHATAAPSVVPPSPVSWLIYPSVSPGFGYPSAHSFVPASSQPVTTSSAQYVLAIVSPTQPVTSNPPVRATPGQETTLPYAFTAGTLPDPSTGTWNMDTGATSHLNNFVNSLSVIFNMCGYPFVSVGDGHSILVANTGHSILPIPLWSLHLNNVLITPHIVKNLINVPREISSRSQLHLQFHRPFLSVSILGINDFGIQEVKCYAVSFQIISFRVIKKSLSSFVTLGKHVRLPFASSDTVVTSCFDIIHSDCDHGGEFDNRTMQKLFADNGIRFHLNAQKPPSIMVNPNACHYNARLVANGSTQLEGIDVDETFSPVVKPKTIQTVLSLATSRHYLIHQLDVKNAFLHGDLSETVSLLDFEILCTLIKDGLDTDYLLLYIDDIVLTASSELLLQQILERAHMVGCNPNRTPVDTKSKLGGDGDPVSDVCLYMYDLKEPHFSALERILRYIRGTLDYGLQLFASSTSSLITYSDADWAGCPTIRRSTSSYCVYFVDNLLSWSSKRQLTLSRSNAEAEYRGVANDVAGTCWLRNLLRELHMPLSSATFLYCDNVSAVYLFCNPVQHQHTKHIEIDINFVRDLAAVGEVRVLRVPSRYQFADIFTKGLLSALYEEFRISLSVWCPPTLIAREYSLYYSPY